MLKKTKNIIIVSSAVIILTALASLPFVMYLKVLPAVVSNPKAIKFAENAAKKYAKVDVKITNPVLKTDWSPVIVFKTEGINVAKDGNALLTVENLDTQISLKDILKKKIIVDKFGLDYVFADVNKLMELAPKSTGEKKESEWDIDLYDLVLSLKKSLILYNLEPDVSIKVAADDLNVDNTQKIERFVHFDIDTEVKKAGKVLHFAIADKNKVVIKNKHIYVNDCILDINKSNVHINASASKAEGFKVNLSSKKFKIKDVTDIVNSNIIVNNGSEILSYFKDMDGNFDFDFNLTKKDMNGKVTLNAFSGKIIPVNNLPVTLKERFS